MRKAYGKSFVESTKSFNKTKVVTNVTTECGIMYVRKHGHDSVLLELRDELSEQAMENT